MRFVASVCSTMDGQGAALDKGLLARFVITCVGALIGMDAIVSLEIRLAVEALWRQESWSGSCSLAE